MKQFLYKLVDLLTPQETSGGLEISDSAIRFISLGEDGAIERQESLRLPPGTVVGGRVKDSQRLAGALAQLKRRIQPKDRRPVQVVLSVTSGNVYAQTIFLPSAAEAGLDEAARLNIEMASPIRLDSAYYNWHRMRQKEAGHTDQIEILSAVANKDVLDEFFEPLREAGFALVAVEFAALSLVRALYRFGESGDKKIPHIVIFINSDGVEFFIVHGSELYFNYYQSWDAIKSREGAVTTASFQELIANETARLVNFYHTRYGGEISDIYVVAPGLYEHVAAGVSKYAETMSVRPLSFSTFDHLPMYWYVSLGAAARARLPRYRDIELSLSGISAKEEYGLIRGTAFVRLWRNIAWASLLFVCILLGSALIFLVRYDLRVDAALRTSLGTHVDTVKIDQLQQQAEEFNTLVHFAQQIQRTTVRWDGFLRRMDALAGAGISLTSINISQAGKVSLSGTAVTREAALRFRNVLSAEDGLRNVDLPLGSLIGEAVIRFTVTFDIADIKVFERY